MLRILNTYHKWPNLVAEALAFYRRWWRLDQLIWAAWVLRLRTRPHRVFLKLAEKSEVLFVLGTGNSLRELSDESWRTIGRHASIGLNDFVVNEFATDAYSLEFFTTSEHTAFVLDRLASKTGRKQILMKVPWWGTTSEPLSPKRPRPHDFFMQTGVPLQSEDARNLYSELLKFHGMRSSHRNVARPLDFLTSAFRICYAGAYAGFSNIVLLGVADGSRDYFWTKHQEPALYEIKTLENQLISPVGSAGSSYLPNHSGAMQYEEALEVLADFSARELEVSISIARKGEVNDLVQRFVRNLPASP